MEFSKSLQQLFFEVKSYYITLTLKETSFTISFHHQVSSKTWQASFSSQFIEDLTSKTGNFKKFKVFTKMLISGLEKSSNSVQIELLAKEEFDRFKLDSKSKNESKLLMIMTYIVEFDKVHYSLPIPLFSKSLTSSKNQEFDQLKSEVSELRFIKLEKDAMEKRMDKMIHDKDTEIYYLEKEKENLQNELDKIKSQMDKIIDQLEIQASGSNAKREAEESKKHKERLENELEKFKRENRGLKEESKKDKARISQLESELKALFDKNRLSRSKSINHSSNNFLQKSYSKFKESNEINNKISHLKILLNKAKE